MSGINWQRVKDSKIVRKGKQYELEAEWKTRRRYAVYRGGEFYIGDRKIPKYKPEKGKPEDGLWFNRTLGTFEIWKKSRKLDSCPWKMPWQELVRWADRHGFGTEKA